MEKSNGEIRDTAESQQAQVLQQERQAVEHFRHLISIAYECVSIDLIPESDRPALADSLFRHFLENERIMTNAQIQQGLLAKQEEMVNRARLTGGPLVPFRKGH